ncbi:permease prefix domain 1-containing protein, partial [Paenibacillus alvei]
MKQIEAFVDEVYHNFGRNKKEIEELKAEMKNHLLEAVHELKSEGKSDQEAIDIAIERFGGEKEMRSIVGQLFKVQKLFARRVLYTALAAIMLPTLLFLYFYVSEKDYNMEINETSGYILQILGDKKSITEETQKRIEDVLKQKNFFLEIEIFESKKLFSAGPEPAPSFQFENN